MDELGWVEQTATGMLEVLSSRDFYLQLAAALATVVVAWFVAKSLRAKLNRTEPSTKENVRARVGQAAYQVQDLLFPAISAILLGITVAVSGEFFEQKWLVQLVQGANFLALIFIVALRMVKSLYIKNFMIYVLGPIIILYAIGVLGEVIDVLDAVAFELGSIKFTLYAAIRTVIFGVVLFWLGRISNRTGQAVIRRRLTKDETTREIALKGFQIALFVVIALIFLQIAGIDLTALVVFGGAIGVGLGFGLQQIASNFISGIIILLDRSISIGDFIELEDGRSGTLRELTMRSATLETFDGKDIMVPNERFITTAFTNWTHNNTKQRYPIYFSVAYGTDLEKLFEIVRDVVSSHPRVLSGEDRPIEERPDAEISSFGDSGIEILVEFWMDGVDDGKNRVGADLLMMIWTALQANDIEIPFPQHEVRMLEPSRKTGK